MRKISEWWASHPRARLLARHGATAFVSVAVALLATSEFLGPAILEACRVVMVPIPVQVQ